MGRLSQSRERSTMFSESQTDGKPMRCLTYTECAEWHSRRSYPMRHIEGCVVGPHLDLQSPPFHLVEFTPPNDSGQKVAFARFLHSLLNPAPELLFWLGDWAVWPSSQHMCPSTSQNHWKNYWPARCWRQWASLRKRYGAMPGGIDHGLPICRLWPCTPRWALLALTSTSQGLLR
jgi:hypothetical protein